MALTFEQQKKIDEIAERAYTPSSNSNKARYELYAYVEEIQSLAPDPAGKTAARVLGAIVMGVIIIILICVAKVVLDWAF